MDRFVVESFDIEPESDLIMNPTNVDEFDEDLEHQLEQQLEQAQQLPEAVQHFITNFHAHIRARDLTRIHHFLYEEPYQRITDRYFKNCPWPPAEVVAPLVGNDQVFLVLYKEMCNRHIFTKLQPDIQQRFESFDNYVDLFEYILKTETLEFDLPNQWLWDIIDEFIYQYQNFTQYKAKLKTKTKEEIEFLKENYQVWNATSVLHYLESLVEKSKIAQKLQNPEFLAGTTEWESGKGHVHTMLGLYSMIGLLRLQCTIGDYNAGLQAVQHIDISKKGPFTRVAAGHISLYYYIGFAYLMMRRYKDAIRSFTTILIYLARTKQYHARSNFYDQISKKNDQIYALLAIAISICPQRIDENIHSTLREKQNEKIQRMQRGDETAFEELFHFCCPKFVAPFSPTFDEDPSTNNNQDFYNLQVKLFLNEVREQRLVPIIRSYLKLYSSIPISKLAKFLEVDDDTFRTQLLSLKHKTRQLTWNGGPVTNGVFTSSTDVDFYVEKDMVFIADYKPTRRYGDFFLRHSNKLDRKSVV